MVIRRLYYGVLTCLEDEVHFLGIDLAVKVVFAGNMKVELLESVCNVFDSQGAIHDHL